MKNDLNVTCAIAWGMLPAPAFKREDERRFRNLANKELRKHGLWLAANRWRDHDMNGRPTELRRWQLMRTGRSRALMAEGKLQHCCMWALKIITPGGNDADV